MVGYSKIYTRLKWMLMSWRNGNEKVKLKKGRWGEIVMTHCTRSALANVCAEWYGKNCADPGFIAPPGCSPAPPDGSG